MAGWSGIFNNTISALGKQAEQASRLQEQIATGLRVIRGSDDPGDAFHIMNLRGTSALLDTYQRNINHLQLDMNQISGVFEEASSSLTRTKQLMTQALSGSYSQENRKAIAVEIDGMIEQLVSLANSKSIGRYLFSGGKSDTQPFLVEREAGKITSITYQGGTEEIDVPVSGGMTMTGMMVGSEVFGTSGPGTPNFLGDTGVSAGEGTSSLRNDAWLTVSHTTTTYDDGGALSGIAEGISSATRDTIIGDHTLTVNNAENTIKLDDGPEATMAGQDNLKLENEHGDVAYVDVTGYNGVFDGTIDLHADGELSLDDGTTTTAISFDTNQAITDPDTGDVLYLNTSNIERTGVEPVHMENAHDLFDLLIHIRDTLNNDRDLSRDEQTTVLKESFDALEGIIDETTRHMTSLGSRLQSLDSLRTNLETVQMNSEAEAAKLGDADMIKIAADLSRAQTFYQMALASSSKILSLTLLDFI
ncbi:MAG: flagellar hook-associated protein FlgL [Phycisphaerae bacterium]